MTNNRFNDFLTLVASQYDHQLIGPKAKALIAIAVEVAHGTSQDSSNSFAASIDQALQQGVSHREIEELLLLLCIYGGFNKVAGCFGTLNKILEQNGNGYMRSAIKQEDYAIRDRPGKVAFYVLLWKRQGIDRELFYNYWKNVHGPLCARLPGQYQYWQLHLDHNQGGIWPQVPGIEYICPDSEQFDGIAELTFETEGARQSFFDSSGILMADEHNLFSKAIGYNTAFGNSRTYVDRLPTGDPNGKLNAIKFHIMLQKANSVGLTEFRRYISEDFAARLAQSNWVWKLRLHLLEEIDNSRPDAAGVSHFEPPEKQYQAAVEIAFANPLEMEQFFASSEYAIATRDLAEYVKGFFPFPERNTYTFVYEGKMTLAGKRGSKVADLILQAGATNQFKENIVSLINGTELRLQSSDNSNSGLGHYLQGVQHCGVTVNDMAQAVEFYTEVLGGKLVVSESELVGDKTQNTLFQTEELQAISSGIDPERADIPHLRSGKEQALDLKFISFGNVVVELLQIREAGKPNAHQSSVGSLPSHIGHVNAMHLSFNVKEGIDLNLFAKTLEEECQRRGMTNVVFNRVIRVKSSAERKAVALKYNSFKFWNEPEDEAPIDWSNDPMEGWSLFYCKGPSGEQLEFNQVTRKVKDKFRQGVQDYNQANGTAFIFPDAQIKQSAINSNNSQLENHATPKIPMTNSPKILAFAGSARTDSFNKKLVQIAAVGAKEAGAEVTYLDLRDLPMPLFDEDLETAEGLPDNVLKFKTLMKTHQGLLIASPEYNSSLSPLLKNAIDWASRPEAGEDALSLTCFKHKVAAIMSASPGGLGGLRGLVHVAAILRNIGVVVLPEQKSIPRAFEAFDTQGRLIDPKQQAEVEALGSKLTKFLTTTRKTDPAIRARQEGTALSFPNAQINQATTNGNSSQLETKEELYFTFSSPVNAPIATVWEIVQDKIENTSRYNPEAQNPQILERYDGRVLRQMNVLGMTVKERIRIDDKTNTITHTLLDNPWFTGNIVNQITPGKNPQDPVVVSYTLDWLPVHTEGKKMAAKISPKLQEAVRNAVLNAKEVAEQQTQALLIPTHGNKSMLEPLPGKNADLVKRLFSRGEAFDSEGLITFFTDKPVYQFGNFEVCLDKQSIKQSADKFFSQVDAVYHEIKMMQEVGNVVFVEMDVFYWRKDGSEIVLPCCDLFRVEGDKFKELRIFMDVNPVFNPSIPVPKSASVLTVSEGKTIMAPGTMKRHFAEHPEGKQRVADGYPPKWSITGPKWAIGEPETDGKSSEQLNAVGELAQAVMAQNWAKVKTYLTDDIFYKVGSAEPRYGRQEVVDFFANTFKTTAIFSGHKVRKVWQEQDIIALEMDAYYELIPSRKQVTISCCDIYRMRGNKVSEWRVYADMSPWQESTNDAMPKQTVGMA